MRVGNESRMKGKPRASGDDPYVQPVCDSVAA